MEKLIGQQSIILSLTEKFNYQIVGVAGSGKTLIAIYKAVLMSIQHPDKNIVFLTFNHEVNKDNLEKVKEIISELKSSSIFKDQISKIQETPQGIPQNLKINTIYQYIKDKVNRLGKNDFKSIGEKKRENLIDKAICETNNLPKRNSIFWKDEIQWLEGMMYSEEDYENKPRSGRRGTRLNKEYRPAVYQLYRNYQKNLKDNKKYFDFDSIYQYLYNKLNNDEFYKDRFNDLKEEEKIDYLIVDEYQDFSIAMFKVLEKLLSKDGKVLLLGDQSQDIFGRLVDPKTLLKKLNLKLIKLSIVYRNSYEIAHLAQVISQKDAFNSKDDKKDEEKITNFNLEVLAHKEKPQVIFVKNDEEKEKIIGAEINRNKDTEIIWLNNKKFNYNNNSTIRITKGQEFNNVIIPDADEISEDEDKDDEELLREHLHKLYTAVTRTKDKLILIMNEKNKDCIDKDIVTVKENYYE